MFEDWQPPDWFERTRMNVPNTMLNVESKKIEEVTISGPDLREGLEYCGKHNLRYRSQSTANYVKENGTLGVLFAVVAVRELTLVEA